jgi:hypothetical protein
LSVPGANWAQRRLIGMVPEGSAVKAGDVVARFSAEKGVLDFKQAQLDLERNTLARAAKASDLESTERRVGADLVEVDTNLAISHRYADVPLQMYSRNQILDAVQDVHYLSDKQDFLQWKRTQASDRGHAELAVLDSQRATYTLNAQTRQGDLNALELKAPHDGVVLLSKNWAGEKPKIGASLWAGTEFGSLPDASTLEVLLHLTQNEAQGVSVDDAVELRAVGRPLLHIDSRVSWVASAAQTRNRQNPIKYVQVKVPVPAAAIESLGLVPGQTLFARLYTQRREQGVSVPNIALRTEAGKNFVDLRQGGRAVAREIVVGERGSARTEVLSGLAPGDLVLLTAASKDAKP